ncbi:hypothetical protein PV326_005918 [Microctonus aethiopoides]|nr:hypothetical protein PV326_005918 [Microctonus aethiopoides]
MCTSTDESYSIAIRYRTVRKRLDNLGYREALSLDALPLTEKLLADLIQTTESLKHFKAIADNNIESCRQSSLSIDPHNYDNTKLVQECNELHNQLLEIKQNNLIQTKDLKRKIQRLESECSDLQLASSRNLKRIKDLELESSNKSKKIQELLGKCCKPTISNAGLASKKRSAYPLRKPVIESEPLPTEINGIIQYPNLTKINPQIVDLVSMADRKISSLNHEVIKLKDELSLQTDNVDTLKTQLAMKEKEINRLKKLHDSGRSYNVTLKECNCHKNEPCCGQCNFINRRTTGNYSQSVCNKLEEISEVKVLQQAKLNLEQQLRDALDKQHDAMSQAMKLAERNEELEKELRDIDHVALAVEADCNSTVKQNNKRVSQLKEKLDNAMQKVRDLENSLLVEKRLSQELRADLEGCKLEKRSIQRTLDNSLEERKRLTDRINELTIIENGLNDEIGRLSKHVETQIYALAELKLANDELIKQTHERILTENAEKKNVTYSAKDKIKKKNNVAVSNDQKHSLSSVNNNNANNMNSNGNNGHGEMSDGTTNKGIKKMTDDSRKLIEQLERDRDYYKDQWNKLNEKLDKASDTENVELWSKICDLKHQLNEKEAQIAELQRDKRGLSREKFNLENRVQMTKPHSRSPCNYCKVCRSMNACICPSSVRITDETSSGPKIMLTRLEHERDTARADVERLTEERDILHQRLELATEAHTNEQRRLRDRLRELETKLDEAKAEKQNFLISQGNRQSTLSSLEDELKDARNELRMVKQELAAQRTQYFQLRALQDQTDQALGDVQSQLAQAESELTRALDRNKNLDQQQLQMDNQIIELKQEINTLRTNMARLDYEKDQLLINLDEKTERIAALEREVMVKEQQTIGVDQQLRDVQHKNQ